MVVWKAGLARNRILAKCKGLSTCQNWQVSKVKFVQLRCCVSEIRAQDRAEKGFASVRKCPELHSREESKMSLHSETRDVLGSFSALPGWLHNEGSLKTCQNCQFSTDGY